MALIRKPMASRSGRTGRLTQKRRTPIGCKGEKQSSTNMPDRQLGIHSSELIPMASTQPALLALFDPRRAHLDSHGELVDE